MYIEHTHTHTVREAIGSLMAQLQEVRSSLATEKARVGTLKKELQDTSRELGEAASRINRQVSTSRSVVHRLHANCQPQFTDVWK